MVQKRCKNSAKQLCEVFKKSSLPIFHVVFEVFDFKAWDAHSVWEEYF
jgi:hypothetical protein